MIFFLLATAIATKCTYDSSRDSTDYLLLDNYHERYCTHACPCDGVEGGCEMDFTYAPFRELENVTGTIEKLTTRDYEFTFAVNVVAGETYSVDEVELKCARMHYKLKEGSTLTVGTQKVSEGAKDATLTTIVRCDTSCTVKDSTFPKSIEDQISFMPEKKGDKFVESALTLDNVVFEVQSKSGHFEKNYARDHLTVTMKKATFVVEEDVSNVDVIGLFYSSIPLVDPVATVELKNNPTNAVFNIVQQCNGNWLVAQKEGSDATIKCEDPTISYGDAQLEEDCEIAFIVIVCIADITLVILICVFVILSLIPVIKKKKAKKYEQI